MASSRTIRFLRRSQALIKKSAFTEAGGSTGNSSCTAKIPISLGGLGYSDGLSESHRKPRLPITGGEAFVEWKSLCLGYTTAMGPSYAQ